MISSSLIQRCSVISWLKRTSSLFERGQVHGLAAAHTLEGGVDLGPFHHAAGQGGGQRRQAQGAVLEDLHQLAAQAEEQHRAELRIDAAAQDQLVAFDLGHRLDGDAQEMSRPGLFGDRLLDVMYRLCARRLRRPG